MSMRTMSLLAAATVAATGGTALVFADDGITIPNGVHLIVPADADYQTRRTATAKFRQPVLDPKTGLYGKDKKMITFTKPRVLSSGQVVFDLIRIEREMYASATAAECAEMNNIGAQLLVDADTAGFWATGSMG